MTTYPDHLDFSWIARDDAGRLAVFVTAGRGPTPDAAFAEGEGALLELEDHAHDLPVCSQAEGPQIDVESFRALAERGFHVFDWTDVHRAADRIDAYEAVARPAAPRFVQDLPASWPVLGLLIALPCDFSVEQRIAVQHMVPCRAPPVY